MEAGPEEDGGAPGAQERLVDVQRHRQTRRGVHWKDGGGWMGVQKIALLCVYFWECLDRCVTLSCGLVCVVCIVIFSVLTLFGLLQVLI